MKHTYQTLYIEHGARDYPITQELLRRFPHSNQMFIDDYNTVFNRPHQNFVVQRQHQALILAKKRGLCFQEGDDRVRSYGDSIVLSSSLVRNCPYHCEYCFLHGMHKTGHMLIHVNIEDYFSELRQRAQDSVERLFVSLGYVSDLLGLEYLLSYCSYWLQNIASLPTVDLEIRTKSDGYTLIRHIKPPQNAILTWSISPPAVCSRYEHGTASTMTRLLHARMALDKGWRVRLCFDPIIYYHAWQKDFEDLLSRMHTILPLERIEKVSFGVFRMSNSHFTHMRKERPAIDLFYNHVETKHALVSYSPHIRSTLRDKAKSMLLQYFDADRLTFVHG